MRSLFGYGLTTKALAKSGGWTIFDDTLKAESLDEYGNTLLSSNKFDPTLSTFEITSPGIPPSHPLIKQAKNLISDYDYFYEKMPFTIWISGTNGKTTTTEMVHHLLENSVVGGNIGLPVSLLDQQKPFWVVETSSFTLHYTKHATPNIYLLLPIQPDHLSWHGSFDAYEKDKLSPLSRMTERDVCILPKKYQNVPTAAFCIYYDKSQDLIDYFSFKHTAFKEPFLLDEVLAKSVYSILYLKEKNLEGFSVDPHKIEEFYDKEQRLWVDDSKATNVDATIQALKRYSDKPIHLVLGGDAKGQDFTFLFDLLKTLNVTLYLIGTAKKMLTQEATKYAISYTRYETLDQCVKEIANVHSQESVALLSPACASLDQFPSYKKRGEVFKNFVNSL